MLKTLALTTCLGLILSTPSLAETYTDPDAAWWGAFLETLDGTAPDLESLALQDPEYLAADEFSRDEALVRVMARLAADRATIDPATAEVVLSIRAEFGDYDNVRGGFPVSIFTPTSRLPLPLGRSLFFRNWQDVALFPATRDEGRALRQKIGQDSLLARVDIRDIRKSQTRSGGYEGHVARVTYSTTKGSEVGQITPPDAIAADPAAVAAQTEAARQKILTAAGIPPLGTSWDDAKQQLQPLWPVMASSDFVNWGTAKRVAYFWKDGAVQQDDPMDPEVSFGPMVSARQLEIVKGYVSKGIAEGARLVCGGGQIDLPGFYIQPTVFADVSDGMTIAREEIFGPVMAVLDFSTEEEVMARANATEFGLAAGVFTRDLTRAHRVVKAFEAGTCYINIYNLAPVEAPFGGSKMSGVGRENSKLAINHYSELKTVYVSMNDVQAPY